MPALDFTGWPATPAAPPAGSAGAPRSAGRAGAPAGGPKTGSKSGSGAANAANEFGALVDRLADAPDEGQASSPGVMARGTRDTGVIGEESAAEPRAKGDAGEASGAANDAPAANTSMASNPAPFPWTLPLSPSLWVIEPAKTPADNAGGETSHGEGEGDGVIGAIAAAAAGAIADGAAHACLATLPGAGADGGADAQGSASTALTVPVDTPIAIDPASTADTASTTPTNGARGAADASVIDASEAFDAALANTAAASANAGEAAAGANTNINTNAGATTAGELLASPGVANGRFDGGESIAGESTSEQPASDALANAPMSANGTNGASRAASSITSNDSTLLAPSAMDSATTAAAVDHAAATTAAGQPDQAHAAAAAPVSGDQAREQAFAELQRALESARANTTASAAAATPRERSADAFNVIQTGASAGAAIAEGAAAADAAVAAAMEAAANAGESANDSGILTDAAGANAAAASTSATGRTSRLRDAQDTSETIDLDAELTGASSSAAAAAAKYADAAGAGTSGGMLDGGSDADAAANAALAGRAGGDAAGSASAIPFDARLLGASRANEHAALQNGSAGESAIVTTAAPEEQAAQIVKSMRLQWRGANGEATLRLQPDHLGPVFVSVRVEQGAVSATVRAETAAAQQWIQQHQQQLRDALDAQGLRVTQFHVTHNPDDRPRRETEQDQQDAPGRRSPRSRARRSDDDRRFEIRL